MVKRVHLLAGAGLVALATLTSCGGGGGGDSAVNAAPAEGAYSISPGQYEMTIRITEANLEGFPAEIQDMARQAQQQPITQSQCIPISFSLDSLDMRNLRFQLPDNMGGCNFAETKVGGGRSSGSMSCELRNLPAGGPDAPRAVNASITFEGTYSPNEYTTTMRGEATEPGNDSRRGNITVEISARRTGDCQAPSRPSPSPYTVPTPPPSYPTTNNMSSYNTTTPTSTYSSNTVGNTAY